jgi:hypothetical protein
VESGAGRLDGMALSGRHEAILVDIRPRDKPFRRAASVIRTVYEAYVFQTLRDPLRCNEIRMVGTDRQSKTGEQLRSALSGATYPPTQTHSWTTGRPPVQVHPGDCYAAGNRRRAINRDEARRLLASGLPASPPLPARHRPAHPRLTHAPRCGERPSC